VCPERSTGARAARRRDLHGEPAPQEGPVARDLHFLDLARALDARSAGARLRPRGRGEFVLAHGRAPGHQEHDIVGHQAQHGGHIAGLRGLHPGADQVADLLFVVRHGSSHGMRRRAPALMLAG
jgi:hypothetical protein